MPTRARRTDANHKPVVEALRACGWLVFDTHALPNFIDVVAYHPSRDVVRLVEIKDGPKKTMTMAQWDMIAAGWPIRTVHSVQDAINLR